MTARHMLVSRAQLAVALYPDHRRLSFGQRSVLTCEPAALQQVAPQLPPLHSRQAREPLRPGRPVNTIAAAATTCREVTQHAGGHRAGGGLCPCGCPCLGGSDGCKQAR